MGAQLEYSNMGHIPTLCATAILAFGHCPIASHLTWENSHALSEVNSTTKNNFIQHVVYMCESAVQLSVDLNPKP